MIRTPELVSIILPVYNGAKFLRAALDSVMQQTYGGFELIVVDDGSTDNSADIAASLKAVRLIRRHHRNVAAARNVGVGSATGSLVTFIDQDDTWPPNRLELQVGFLASHRDVDIVLGRYRVCLEPDVLRPPWIKAEAVGRVYPIKPLTLMTRGDVFRRIGEFDESYQSASDSDWLKRARDANIRTAVLPDMLLNWRIHDSNASYERAIARSENLRFLHASIVRRRHA